MSKVKYLILFLALTSTSCAIPLYKTSKVNHTVFVLKPGCRYLGYKVVYCR